MSVVISLDTTAAVRAAAVTCQRRKVLCGSRGKGRTAGLQHLLQQPLFTLQRNLLHYLQSVCLGQYPTNLCSPAVPLLTHTANLGFKPWPEAALCSLFLERPSAHARWTGKPVSTAARQRSNPWSSDCCFWGSQGWNITPSAYKEKNQLSGNCVQPISVGGS